MSWQGITDHIPELSYVFEKLSLLAVGGGEKISTNGMHLKYNPKAAESFVINAKKLYASDDHSLWIDHRICDRDLEKELLDVLQKMYGKKIAESIVKGFRSIDTELKAKYDCPLYNLLGKNAGEYSINDETEYAPSDSSTDYKKVIERLMKEMIVEKESTEILDRNLYCYGLDMYGDVPVIFVLPNQGMDEYYESLVVPNYVEKVFMRIEDEK